MIFYLSQTLVFAGALFLGSALFPIWRLIGQLPAGPIRRHWHFMTVLIVVCLVGYLTYAATLRDSHATLIELIVPGVFFLGASFVWMTSSLSLQTTMDVMRMSLLEREAVTDPLTGAFNRRFLDRRLNEEVLIERRYGRPLSILMIDIDHFKRINDTYGHQCGDQVLTALSEIVANALRETDILARYGGEEFMVIAPQTPLAGAAELAERLRRDIEAHPFAPSQAGAGLSEIAVTVSVGVASLGHGIDSSEKLVHAADANLYRAKQGGRNRVVCNSLPSDSRDDRWSAQDAVPVGGT